MPFWRTEGGEVRGAALLILFEVLETCFVAVLGAVLPACFSSPPPHWELGESLGHLGCRRMGGERR